MTKIPADDIQRQGDCVVLIAKMFASKYGFDIDYVRPMAGKVEKIFREEHYELEPEQFKEIVRQEFRKANTWDKLKRFVTKLEKDQTRRIGEIATEARKTRRRPQRKEISDTDQVNLFHAKRREMMRGDDGEN